ncbi:MAG: DUF4252 domain-containing protein [Acidobacteria bacterium]|nr:DUF4252 domain-containing protein [Acidobacteriota bacterium]
MNNRYLYLPLLFAAGALGQEFHQQINWDKLAPKAIENVEVNLDGNLLQMAAKFLSGQKPDEAKVKKLIGDIKGIYVRSLTFAKEGEYSMADVESIRSQLKAPAWSKIVDVRSAKPGGDNAGVYMKTDGNQILGIVVIAAEPKELTVVNIVGALDPENLRELSGKFGIPKIELEKKTKK